MGAAGRWRSPGGQGAASAPQPVPLVSVPLLPRTPFCVVRAATLSSGSRVDTWWVQVYRVTLLSRRRPIWTNRMTKVPAPHGSGEVLGARAVRDLHSPNDGRSVIQNAAESVCFTLCGPGGFPVLGMPFVPKRPPG